MNPTTTPAPKKQVMRYSDPELLVIKGLFKENEPLLKALRKAFLQLPITEIESTLLKDTFSKEENKFILKKTFNPEIDGDAPMHQITDIWLNVAVKDKPTDLACIYIFARQLLIDFMAQQLSIIGTDVKDQPLQLSEFVNVKGDGKLNEEIFASVMARNDIVSHVEAHLFELLLLAQKDDRTPEQKIADARKDSSQ